MKKTKVTIEYYMLDNPFEDDYLSTEQIQLFKDQVNDRLNNLSIEGMQQLVDEGLLLDVTEDKCKVVAIEVIDLPKSISDEEFDRKFDAGEDITDYIDYSTITRFNKKD